MKKYLLPIFLIAFWCCEEDKESPPLDNYDDVIGTWTLESVCTYSDSTCSGECTDATEEYGPAGNFSMTFNEDQTGIFDYQTSVSDNFGWSGSNPYILTGEGDGINVYVSDGSITFTALDSICIQYTLTK